MKAPYQCKTFDEVCKIPRDNIDVGNSHWMMIDAGPADHEVVITEQRSGDKASAQIRIPREVFVKMARWYLTGHKNGMVTR